VLIRQCYDGTSFALRLGLRAVCNRDGSSALGGSRALYYGFQYFALGWDALLRLAGLEAERVAYREHYAATKPMWDAKLARLSAD
jgi:hypothetical protein